MSLKNVAGTAYAIPATFVTQICAPFVNYVNHLNDVGGKAIYINYLIVIFWEFSLGVLKILLNQGRLAYQSPGHGSTEFSRPAEIHARPMKLVFKQSFPH